MSDNYQNTSNHRKIPNHKLFSTLQTQTVSQSYKAQGLYTDSINKNKSNSLPKKYVAKSSLSANYLNIIPQNKITTMSTANLHSYNNHPYFNFGSSPTQNQIKLQSKNITNERLSYDQRDSHRLKGILDSSMDNKSNTLNHER